MVRLNLKPSMLRRHCEVLAREACYVDILCPVGSRMADILYRLSTADRTIGRALSAHQSALQLPIGGEDAIFVIIH